MSHPCNGHACDHCYVCDVEGRCCACEPAPAPAVVPDEGVRLAVLADAIEHRGLAALIRIDLITAYLSRQMSTQHDLGGAHEASSTDSRPALPAESSPDIKQIHTFNKEQHVV